MAWHKTAAPAGVPPDTLALLRLATLAPSGHNTQPWRLSLAGNRAEIADPAFVGELAGWIRFSAAASARSRDGLFGPAVGSPELPDAIGRRLLPLVLRPGADTRALAEKLASSGALVVLVARRPGPDGFADAGRACQRLALAATAAGLKLAFVNQAVEVPALRRDLASLLATGGRRPNLVLRIGNGPDLPRSLRRPVAAVLDDPSAVAA